MHLNIRHFIKVDIHKNVFETIRIRQFFNPSPTFKVQKIKSEDSFKKIYLMELFESKPFFKLRKYLSLLAFNLVRNLQQEYSESLITANSEWEID